MFSSTTSASLRRQLRLTGIHDRSISASARCVVWIARSKSDSCTTPGRSPASFIKRPASTASFTPRSLNGTSVQPVKRFSRFQVLSPWRSRTSVPGCLAVAPPHSWGGGPEGRRGWWPEPLALRIDLGRNFHDRRELLSVETRAADEHPVAKGQLHVLLDVVRLDAAAVKDAHLARGAGADHLADDPADEAHGLVSVLVVGVPAAADCPHRLIGDDEARRVVRRAPRQSRLDLG